MLKIFRQRHLVRVKTFCMMYLLLLASTIVSEGFSLTNMHNKDSNGDLIFPKDLRCEYAFNPLGVDTQNPRFSWVLESSERGEFQTAYQILVSSSKENINRDIGDMWDSGKVISNRSVNIVYKGRRLESERTYYWKVRCWDKDDNIGPYSDVATFVTGILNEYEWKSKWIQSPNSNNSIAPLFRKEFTIKKEIKSAIVYISGLGYYELYINGVKVGDHVLDPGTTEYDKIALYVTYNVTEYLKVGANVLGVILGNGWFSPPPDMAKHSLLRKYSDRPKLIMQMHIDFTDGTTTIITTDDTWKTADSPIVYNGIWNGEIYDARLEKEGWSTLAYDDSEWSKAEVVPSPTEKLVSQIMPAIKVTKTIRPVKILNPKPNVYVYDFNQNFAGWVRLIVSGPRGTKVTLRYAEVLNEDGTINMENLRSARATDIYILKGEGIEVYEPRFTYHGFRYVEVTGFPGEPGLENLLGRVVHSSVDTTGTFVCSNSLLNQIQHNIIWGQLSNLMSIPTDCPQRDERMGWMGDAQLSAEEAIYNFWMPEFYEKWVNDIKIAQSSDGAVPDVVPPHWSIYPSDPAWGTACVLIPWYLYQYYGDEKILEDSYSCMKNWVDFLSGKSVSYIVDGKYGDWCEPGAAKPKKTPLQLTSTGYYYYDALILSKVASLLGKHEDAEKYFNLANSIKEAFNKKFLNKDKNQYATGSQTSNAFPLFLGIAPEENKESIMENLINDIMTAHNGHLDTGILGTKFLADLLPDSGCSEVLYILATRTTYPSWRYWIKLGATTLWERWEPLNVTGPGMNSYNHIMFGSIGKWFYAGLAGIRPYAPGYSRILIKPQVVGDLKWTNASVKTIRGLVASSWIRKDTSFFLNVSIPVNAVAIVSIPKIGLENVVVKEGDKTIWARGFFVGGVKGIYDGFQSDDCINFKMGSGSYQFKLSGDLPAFPIVRYIDFRASKTTVEPNMPFLIYLTLKNLRSKDILWRIDLYVDGKKTISRHVCLRAKEEKKIVFKYSFSTIGEHEIKVTDTVRLVINVNPPFNLLIPGIAAILVTVTVIVFYIKMRRKESKEKLILKK